MKLPQCCRRHHQIRHWRMRVWQDAWERAAPAAICRQHPGQLTICHSCWLAAEPRCMPAAMVAAGAVSELDNCTQPAAAHLLLLKTDDETVQQHRRDIGSARVAVQTAQTETSLAEQSLACPSLLRICLKAHGGQAKATLRRFLSFLGLRCH